MPSEVQAQPMSLFPKPTAPASHTRSPTSGDPARHPFPQPERWAACHREGRVSGTPGVGRREEGGRGGRGPSSVAADGTRSTRP